MLSRRDFGKLIFAGMLGLGLAVLPKPRESKWVGIATVRKPDGTEEFYVNGKWATYEEMVAALKPIAFWPIELSH